MADYASPGAGDFEAMARQYWNLWGDALRQAGGGMGQAPGWQQALDWWSRLMPAGAMPAGDAVHRFRQHSGDWYGLMQQLAARFAGQDANAADVAQAWKQMLGVDAARGPLLDFMRSLQGGGAGGFDQWYQMVAPYLDSLRREGERWLHLPAFGPAREHQERWQALAQAQQDYQRCLGEYERVMLKVARLAAEHFEALLAARAEPGKQITSARALFDLWIDAAEQAYAEVALSPEFRHVYGALTNAQMRLRLRMQGEVEQFCQALGMPTRTEVDAAHRKIADLERRLRGVMRGGAGEPAAARTPAPAEPKAVRKAASKTAARKASGSATKKAGKPAGKPKRSEPSPPARQAGEPRRARAEARPAARRQGEASARARSAPAAEARRKAGGDAVVSMKDWVARYADGAPEAAGGNDKGKRRRGQGDRK